MRTGFLTRSDYLSGGLRVPLLEDRRRALLLAHRGCSMGPPEPESLRQDTSRAAELRAKLSRRGLRCPLEGIVVQHLTVARVAEGLGVAWNTANDAVLAESKRS